MRARLGIVSCVVILGIAAGGLALGQSDNWFPSRWGAADQRGAANRITPAKVLEAKSMITKGNVYLLELFHAERHTTASHFRVDTTLTFVDCGIIPPA